MATSISSKNCLNRARYQEKVQERKRQGNIQLLFGIRRAELATRKSRVHVTNSGRETFMEQHENLLHEAMAGGVILLDRSEHATISINWKNTKP